MANVSPNAPFYGYAGGGGGQAPTSNQPFYGYAGGAMATASPNSYQAQYASGQAATPNTPFPGFSNYGYPGETGTQTANRMQMEYEIMGQRPLPAQWDAQRPGGGGMWGASPTMPGLPGTPFLTAGGQPVGQGSSYGGSASGGYDFGGGGAGGGAGPGAGVVGPGGGAGGGYAMGAYGANDPLAQARRAAFGSLNSYYDRQYGANPLAQNLQGSIADQLSGANSPITAQRASLADAAAGQFAREQAEMARGAANAGLGSRGGVAGTALAAARSRIDAGQRQGQRDLTISEAQRRERALAPGMQYLQQQAQADWNRTGRGVDLLSRFEMTGEGPFGTGGGGGGLSRNLPTGRATGGVNQYAPGAGGVGGSSYGGVTMIPGMNAQPWRSGGSSARNNRGGTMGFDLSGYSSGDVGPDRYSGWNERYGTDPRTPVDDYAPQTMGYDPYQPMPPPSYGSPQPTFQPPQGDFGYQPMPPPNPAAPQPTFQPPQGDFGGDPYTGGDTPALGGRWDLGFRYP